MPSFTLELLVDRYGDYLDAESISLDLVNHVHKRVGRFIYNREVRPDAVPVAYIENKGFDSRYNLLMTSRAYSVPANSDKNTALRSPYALVNGSVYTSQYRRIAATNQTFVDDNGRKRPLFYRHVLPEDTVECELQVFQSGNKHVVDTGYKIDLESKSIFTNYNNFFDANTGAYKFFYVVSSDSSGTTTRTLLNPIPAAKQADWEDIDVDTGRLLTGYPTYSVEKTASGYTFLFNSNDNWYVKPIETGLLKAERPAGIDPDSPWFLRFTDGDITAVVNDRARRYFVPEFSYQAFSPYKPFVFSTYTRMIQVNRNTLAATRKNLGIDPIQGRHIDIVFENSSGEVIKALSTDPSKEGARYFETNVFYETDKISSYDNKGGFINLGLQIHRSWTASASFYYEADDYEYTGLNLNPITNKRAFDYTWVFYAVPDVNDADVAIHYLAVDSSGEIAYCSQAEGISLPNLQLKNLDGSYNPNTVVGLKYISDIDSDTFITRYTAGFQNDYGYMILSEVSIADTSIEENQFEVDVRRPGNAIDPSVLDRVLLANPRILQSILGYGEDGQVVPENAVMVVDAPYSLLEKYGGLLTKNQAEELLKLHVPAGVYCVFNWEYPESELSGSSTVAAQVDLSWTWEGPGYTYNVYRKDTAISDPVLIHSEVAPPEGTISYTDTAVTSGSVYHYAVKISDGTYEYPSSNKLAVMVQS